MLLKLILPWKYTSKITAEHPGFDKRKVCANGDQTLPKFESFTQVSFSSQAVAFQVKSFDKGLGENRPDRIQHLDDQALDLEREDLLHF